MLNHTRTTGNEVAIVEHLEEYLRRDVVRIVARQHKLLTTKHLVQVHTQEVGTQDILAQFRKILVQIRNTLAVYLNHLQRARFLHQILRHHSHTRPHLQYGQIGVGLIHGVSYALGYRQVSQEVLT